MNSVKSFTLTLSAGALAALLFAVPFAFGIGAAGPLTFIILAVFCGFLIVFPPLAAVVALIGVADQFLDLRRRTGLVRSGQEA